VVWVNRTQVGQGDRLEGAARGADLDRGRAHQAAAVFVVAGRGDPPVFAGLDPRGKHVGEPEPVRGLQRDDVTIRGLRADLARRRLVVVRDAALEGGLHAAGDGLRGDPGQ
jgi:hypothetical protein